MLTEAARAKGLDLVVSCHPDVPAVLAGDPTRLAQVVTNLVVQRGQVHRARRRDRAGHDGAVRGRPDAAAASRSRDTGVGVPPAKLAHALRPVHPGRLLDHPASTAAPGSAWRSRARSSRRWAARIGYTPEPGRRQHLHVHRPARPGRGRRHGRPVRQRRRRARPRAARRPPRPRRRRQRDQPADPPRAARVVGRRPPTARPRPAERAGAARGLGGPYDVVLLDLLDARSRTASTWPAQVRARPDARRRAAAHADVGDHARPRRARDAGVDRGAEQAGAVAACCAARCCDCSPASPPTPTAAAAGHRGPHRARAGSWWSRTTRSTSWSPSGCSRRSATTPTTAADGSAASTRCPEGASTPSSWTCRCRGMDGYTATRRIRAAETGDPAADHRDDRRRRRGRARALPGRRHGRLPHQAGRRRPGSPRRSSGGCDPRRRRTPTASTSPASTSCASSTTPVGETSYVDRAIGELPGQRARRPRRPATAAAARATPSELGAVAHRLAGAALNLGAVALGEAARRARGARTLTATWPASRRRCRCSRSCSPRTSTRCGPTSVSSSRREPGRLQPLFVLRPRRRRAGPPGGPAATSWRTWVRVPQPSSICRLRSVANASPSSARTCGPRPPRGPG